MQDSFNIRVDRAFGALSSSLSSPIEPLRSPWCLTDEEVERREWNRDRGSPETEDIPNPFQFGEKQPADYHARLEDMDALEEEDEESRESTRDPEKRGDFNDEEWEIKSSIGMDCTLDNEEEEDQYDKVAVGQEKAGDRLYMSDVIDYSIGADASTVLPVSLKNSSKDPRANHTAAKIRLKEDADAANSEVHDCVSRDCKPKPILKRKDTESDSKSRKRVRFESECKYESDEDSGKLKDVGEKASLMEEVAVSNESFSLPKDYPSGIPDYMRNPSRYTCYTFDSSSEVDDPSNKQAYMDFLNQIKMSDPMGSDEAFKELPKSVTFVPRRRTGDNSKTDNCGETTGIEKRGLTVGIAAADNEADGVCAMEEDDLETVGNKSITHRAGRQYRVKPSLEFDEAGN